MTDLNDLIPRDMRGSIFTTAAYFESILGGRYDEETPAGKTVSEDERLLGAVDVRDVSQIGDVK
jgi:hypothetical protein